jgi:hypothetical protein
MDQSRARSSGSGEPSNFAKHEATTVPHAMAQQLDGAEPAGHSSSVGFPKSRRKKLIFHRLLWADRRVLIFHGPGGGLMEVTISYIGWRGLTKVI